MLLLVEGLTDDIRDSVASAEEKFSINLNKAKTNFWLSLYNDHNDDIMVT